MFSLNENDLRKKILGCADGPSSFNSELTEKGGSVCSVDPIYCFSEEDIRIRIQETCSTILEQVKMNRDQFVWKDIPDIESLERIRMSSMNRFLEDFSRGHSRYQEGKLPALPFLDDSFDLALCSHFLFLYSDQFDEAFHRLSIEDLCRVAREVRIFPLHRLDGSQSEHI